MGKFVSGCCFKRKRQKRRLGQIFYSSIGKLHHCCHVYCFATSDLPHLLENEVKVALDCIQVKSETYRIQYNI